MPGVMTAALTRVAQTGVLTLTGEELTAWRLAQPGEFKKRNNQVVKGWSQKKAAEWYGCSERQWRRWEAAKKVPLPVIKAVIRYGSSLQSELDRIMA